MMIFRNARTFDGHAARRLEGEIGCVKPGAHAELIVVDGDPLKDIALLAQDGKRLSAIVRGGEVVKWRSS